VLVGLIRDLAVAVGERLRARGLPQRWLEYGAGNGNLTLPLAAVSEGVAALEVDPLAIAGLAQGAAAAGLTDKVRVLRRAEPAPAALVDPPRAGLGPFLPELLRLAPEELLYVSCHGPALVGDLGPLWEAGYRPRRLTGVDSFPQSPHAEWVLWLSRGSAEGGDGA
jgi:tRNA/tmRNA/rRNA uracil-C5-methylase (TrmA/RlmC/RlmD family)